MHTVSDLPTLYVTGRQEWRRWLAQHFESEREIWLLYPKKSSGKPRISYNDAVEEALCFGWIDSIVRSVDAEHSAQRFTPRNPRSNYSQPNRERLKWLMEQGLVHPSLHAAVARIIQEQFVFPIDIMAALQNNQMAWEHWQRFSPAYHRIRVAYVDNARTRPEEFKKRLQNLIKKSSENKQIGYGGIEKYY